ncbi:MAG: hypothetical protein IJ168_08120 [Eubacterium sp.]|nr:hypothetical protein [Eubacterium sp.]
MEYYKFINETLLDPAPKHLIVSKLVKGETHTVLCLTPSEKQYNENGYYRREFTPAPDDGYAYTAYWDEATKDRPYHVQCWRRGEKLDQEPELTDVQQAFNILAENVQGVTTIKGLREALITSANQISEVSE